MKKESSPTFTSKRGRAIKEGELECPERRKGGRESHYRRLAGRLLPWNRWPTTLNASTFVS